MGLASSVVFKAIKNSNLKHITVVTRITFSGDSDDSASFSGGIKLVRLFTHAWRSFLIK